MKNYKAHIKASVIACTVGVAGEFIFIFLLGTFYPGYSQLTNTMSSLGASASPVSIPMSAWWTIAGLLFIFFGTGFRRAFSDRGRFAVLASWLIIIYGIGEGIGSGLFRADHLLSGGLTTAGIIHDILGGIGVFAILLLPLVMQKVIISAEMPGLYLMSQIIFFTGIAMVLLFTFRYSPDKQNFLSRYKGLWQRLFMLNTYVYFMAIAVAMWRRDRKG